MPGAPYHGYGHGWFFAPLFKFGIQGESAGDGGAEVRVPSVQSLMEALEPMQLGAVLVSWHISFSG